MMSKAEEIRNEWWSTYHDLLLGALAHTGITVLCIYSVFLALSRIERRQSGTPFKDSLHHTTKSFTHMTDK